MKENLFISNYEDRAGESRRWKSAEGESFVTIFDQMHKQKLSCICSVCGSCTGDIIVSTIRHVDVSSTDFDDKELYHMIPLAPVWDELEIQCPECERKTVHYTVDAGMLPIIQKLNDIDLETKYCCEGHGVSPAGIDVPYVMFKDKSSLDYFDQEHPLLKCFDIDPELKGIWLKSSTPLNYYTDGLYLKDLEEYIDKVVMPKILKPEEIDGNTSEGR